jgi:hypothetical protein
MGIDDTERRVGWIAVGIEFLWGVYWFVELVRYHFSPGKVYASATNGLCPSGYTFHAHAAVKTHQCSAIWDPSYGWIETGIAIALVIALAYFVWRRKRAGIIVASFLGALSASGSILFIAFLGYGGWILYRAFLLQRYGDPSFMGSRRIKAVQAQERRQNRASASPRRSIPEKKSRDSVPDDTRAAPEASKRYTPKKPSGKQ